MQMTDSFKLIKIKVDQEEPQSWTEKHRTVGEIHHQPKPGNANCPQRALQYAWKLQTNTGNIDSKMEMTFHSPMLARRQKEQEKPPPFIQIHQEVNTKC